MVIFLGYIMKILYLCIIDAKQTKASKKMRHNYAEKFS